MAERESTPLIDEAKAASILQGLYRWRQMSDDEKREIRRALVKVRTKASMAMAGEPVSEDWWSTVSEVSNNWALHVQFSSRFVLWSEHEEEVEFYGRDGGRLFLPLAEWSGAGKPRVLEVHASGPRHE